MPKSNAHHRPVASWKNPEVNDFTLRRFDRHTWKYENSAKRVSVTLGVGYHGTVEIVGLPTCTCTHCDYHRSGKGTIHVVNSKMRGMALDQFISWAVAGIESNYSWPGQENLAELLTTAASQRDVDLIRWLTFGLENGYPKW
jgi:hypothetical protein